jgi:hypothetical protein
LGQLVEAGLLFCRGSAPHASYLFKHALVQDAAYSTLLRGKRQELHARVASVLEQHFAEVVERQPELLAHHLTAARDTGHAVDQWLNSPLTKYLSFRVRQHRIAPGLLDAGRNRIYGPWDSFVAQRERPSTLSTGC